MIDRKDYWAKKKILGCIFSEKVVLEKGRVATFSFTTPIRVLTNAVMVFESGETKKEVENDLLSCLAPLIAQSCNQYLQILEPNKMINFVI